MTTWKNWIEAQAVDATLVPAPTALDVLAAVKSAAQAGAQIRAVGSGHATSAVARPVDGQRYVHVASSAQLPDWKWYRPGAFQGTNTFARVHAGMRIADVNALLAQQGRALPTMGSFDHQTVAGVISTGTHGSGLDHQTISDLVVAIELVTDEVPPGGGRLQRLLRLEPANGPTDGAKFLAEKGHRGDPTFDAMELEQNTAAFYAAVVGLGTFGIVTAVTLRVCPAFWLREHRQVQTWRNLRNNLLPLVRAHRMYFEIDVIPNPIPDGNFAGEILTQITWRDAIAVPVPTPNPPPKRHDAGTGLSFLPKILGTGLLNWFDLGHRDAYLREVRDVFMQRATDSQQHPQESRSDIISRTSLGDSIRATSCEISVPVDRAPDAIDAILALARAREPTDPDWFHTSPLGVRFVSGSAHDLAHTQGRESCTIEVPFLVVGAPMTSDQRKRVIAAHERMMSGVQAALAPLGGRPHWGQRFYAMDASSAVALYPSTFAAWRAQAQRFDAFGTFSNSVTHQLGL